MSVEPEDLPPGPPDLSPGNSQHPYESLLEHLAMRHTHDGKVRRNEVLKEFMNATGFRASDALYIVDEFFRRSGLNTIRDSDIYIEWAGWILLICAVTFVFLPTYNDLSPFATSLYVGNLRITLNEAMESLVAISLGGIIWSQLRNK